MAKSRSFFGLRRGSTKSHTFQVNKGVQITKDRVYDVANPRTTAQMAQRLTFATASKFYNKAVQAFFKFAFEGKRPADSNYNAFMRLNVGVACASTRLMMEDGYPALGQYLMTQGQLGSPRLLTVQHSSGSELMALEVEGSAEEGTTVGDFWRAFINTYPMCQDGDIVTSVVIKNTNVVNVRSLAEAKQANALSIPLVEGGQKDTLWEIRQSRIDVSDSTLVDDNPASVFAMSEWTEIEDSEDGMGKVLIVGADASSTAPSGLTNVMGSAIMVSRPVGTSEVLVTSSTLTPSAGTQIAVLIGLGSEWKKYCGDTYEMAVSALDADAILKGEILASVKTLTYEALKSETSTTKTKITTILAVNNVSAEGVTCNVTVGSNNAVATFANYQMYKGDTTAFTQHAVYKTQDGVVSIFIPVSGSLVVEGGVYMVATSAAKCTAINKN